MYMHSAASLADGNLGGEGYGNAVLVAQLTHHPFGDDQLVGSLLEVRGQEFYLVLLVH